MGPPEGTAGLMFTNFNYADDMKGSRCPFQSHIRKTNPRGDTVRFFEGDYEFERNHRIVRRGVPFGKQPARRNDARLGRSASSSFATRATSGTSSSSCKRRGRTPSTSCARRPGSTRSCGQGEQLIGGQAWPSEYGDDSTAKAVQFDFSPYVTLKGGEYFFAPSLEFPHQAARSVQSVTGRSGRRRAIRSVGRTFGVLTMRRTFLLGLLVLIATPALSAENGTPWFPASRSESVPVVSPC